MSLDTDRLHRRVTASLSSDLVTEVRSRLEAALEPLVDVLSSLYGGGEGFEEWIGSLLDVVGRCIAERPEELRELDRSRSPGWLGEEGMLGYCAYADRFGGDLRGVADRIPYLEELGVRYLHLLPFHRARPGDSDGGFAVSDYEEVEPRLGTVADLEALTAELRRHGISLCADFVLNHTADDHPWARAARAGDARHRRFYHVLEGPAQVAAAEAHLVQVFPTTAPGNFTEVPELGGWVWTTFYPFQWDLDWSNPEVFAAMAGILLRNANRGIEVFRLDAIPFLWKRPGTRSMNQPEVHRLVRALRLVLDLAAPATALKAEAIVPLDDAARYFGSEGRAECQVAYNSTLMAAGWAALAEGKGAALGAVIRRLPLPRRDACWLSYVRCHDDIGWKVLGALRDEGGDELFDLPRVSRFFAGREPGSYARGAPFQTAAENEIHGSCGMTAALVGLGDAEVAGDEEATARAVRRLLLLYGVALALPGLPLLYMGDEIGLGNDASYLEDEQRRRESRWLHRPAMDWHRAARRHDPTTIPGLVFQGLSRLLAVRKKTPDLAAFRPAMVLEAHHLAVLALRRGETFGALFNLSEQVVTARWEGGGGPWADLLYPEAPARGDGDILLEPLSFLWLRRAGGFDRRQP